MEKLYFLGRENYVDYLWARQVTAEAYFNCSGKLLYTNSVLSFYATERELAYAKTFAHKLIQHVDDVVKLEQQFKATLENVTAMKPLYTAKSLRMLSNKELYRRFVDLISILGTHIRSYRQTEPHYVEHLEQAAIEHIKAKTTDDPYHVLATILAHKQRRHAALNLSLEDKQLFATLDLIARVRFEARKIFNPLGTFSERALKEAAARCDLAINQLSNLDIGELEALLICSKIPDLEVVNKRQHGFALEIEVVNHKRIVCDLSDAELKKLIAYDRGDVRATTLSGATGYPGKITGIARIAPLLSEPEAYKKYVASLRSTDVLIAPMTGPGLTPAFAKVAAVVTDEGGLMSHAALVAREQKVPCVIGTRLATKIFTDGQIVVVDATNGLVQKQNSHE